MLHTYKNSSVKLIHTAFKKTKKNKTNKTLLKSQSTILVINNGKDDSVPSIISSNAKS